MPNTDDIELTAMERTIRTREDRISEAKLRIMQAESNRAKAFDALVAAEVEIKLARVALESLENPNGGLDVGVGRINSKVTFDLTVSNGSLLIPENAAYIRAKHHGVTYLLIHLTNGGPLPAWCNLPGWTSCTFDSGWCFWVEDGSHGMCGTAPTISDLVAKAKRAFPSVEIWLDPNQTPEGGMEVGA